MDEEHQHYLLLPTCQSQHYCLNLILAPFNELKKKFFYKLTYL